MTYITAVLTTLSITCTGSAAVFAAICAALDLWYTLSKFQRGRAR